MIQVRRRGKPVTLHIDWKSVSRKYDDEARAELAEKERKFLGTFDTGLPCNCGKANIMDHATAHDTKAPPRRIQDIRFGSPPDIRSQNKSFRVFHAYSCDVCGVEYRNDVIEGVREYVPLEQRPGA